MNLQSLRTSAQNLALRAGVFAVTAAPFVARADGDPFTTAMTDATAKVTTYAGALVGLAAVAVVFMIAVKYVKKITKAA